MRKSKKRLNDKKDTRKTVRAVGLTQNSKLLFCRFTLSMEPTPSSTQEDTLAGDLNYSSSSNHYVSFSTPPRHSVRCPTLTSFLNQLNLSQYQGLFVDAGVGENDIEQLLGFDEAELKEVMSAISMKPFHSAAFKKGIRELRQNFSSNTPMLSSGHSYTPLTYSTPISPVELQQGSLSPPRKLINIAPAKDKIPMYMERIDKPISSTSNIVSTKLSPTKSIHNPLSNESSYLHQQMQDDVYMEHEPTHQDIHSVKSEPTNMVSTESQSSMTVNTSAASKDVIIHHATIYGKNSPRQLTSYEQAINSAAIELALQDPTLVANKGALFDKAKAKLLLGGYSYKRGASRSKLNPNAPKPGSRASRATLRAKRNAHAAQNSENRNARIAELERKLKVKETQYELAIELVRVKSTHNDSEALEKAQVSLEELEKERIEINKELTTLKSKERKHRWYEQKKKERMDSGFDEVDESSNNNNGQREPEHEDSIIEDVEE
ncbi:uncharacterized protein OCT59_018780 [Rhizophagus irregularis]|uniref:NAB co-repressor domain-containing protein n=4 Tax=Rhizophagus irregularis TaxID=588596 RepID=A0A916EBW1_9GLOM|nr:hypothetical protein OCT59_018780 [Rhizophagus irregularis]CAB5375953.1 unnamed protein product [Rhizophagus irregularis]CAB5392397.1 unnamed protein product [Rhizophagus irregularis]